MRFALFLTAYVSVMFPFGLRARSCLLGVADDESASSLVFVACLRKTAVRTRTIGLALFVHFLFIVLQNID